MIIDYQYLKPTCLILLLGFLTFFPSFLCYLRNTKAMVSIFIFVVGSSIFRQWPRFKTSLGNDYKTIVQKNLTRKDKILNICFSINFQLSTCLFPVKIQVVVFKLNK